MNAATRLGVYAAGLAVVFGAAYTTADAVVPESTVTSWTERGQDGGDGEHRDMGAGTNPPAQRGAEKATESMVQGTTLARDGYELGPITAPTRLEERTDLSFRILDDQGRVVTRFATAHERKLHLIVVRTDGTQFRHVHPVMDAGGTWSLPWSWAEAGTYRVYADFVPENPDGEDADPVTLTRSVEVAGEVDAVQPKPTRTAEVHGFTVDLTGDLVAGTGSDLTLKVSRDGKPVTTLQPYLGAFGHLVALRGGDLAYLHVHAEGDAPERGARSGPDLEFVAEAPTPGRYLLYLDFRVDGTVHTAPFVVDTAERDGSGSDSDSDSGDDGHGH